MDTLSQHILEHESFGCTECYLGIQSMPGGYALMLDPDRMYYYWLRYDGSESAIHWDRWAIYKWAKNHAMGGNHGKNEVRQKGQYH